ncbi:UDP-2,3-diacylglucosamine diphosphatase [bacterium]|nr:UDP-2,3-diacylglucosamine diphosphatase [bacterium]
MIDITGKRALIVSDIHYGIKNSLGSSRFLQFLDDLPECDILILLGDIFDLLFSSVENRFGINGPVLKRLSAMNIPVYFIPGNHDSWGSEVLEKYSIRECPRGLGLSQNGKRFFLHHGDGFNPSDIGYRALKGLLRQRFLVRLGSSLVSPSAILRSAMYVSRTSPLKGHSMQEVDAMAATAFQLAEKYHLHGIILGHSHFPELRVQKGVVYANSGDWIRNFSYLTLEKGLVELHFA